MRYVYNSVFFLVILCLRFLCILCPSVLDMGILGWHPAKVPPDTYYHGRPPPPPFLFRHCFIAAMLSCHFQKEERGDWRRRRRRRKESFAPGQKRGGTVNLVLFRFFLRLLYCCFCPHPFFLLPVKLLTDLSSSPSLELAKAEPSCLTVSLSLFFSKTMMALSLPPLQPLPSCF